MSLRAKLTASALLLAVVPLVLACLVVGYQSYESGKAALNAEVERNLASRRNMKREEIEGYLKRIERQILAQAANNMFVDAAKAFRKSYREYPRQVRLPSDAGERLENYYREDFLTSYLEKNQGRSLDKAELIQQLDDVGSALQANYIALNPNPLGAKDQLDSADDGSHYSQQHARYHPAIRYFLNQFGYYDIFIVDPDTGDVVYSVFKELDFATSLERGAYRNSGLAEAYRSALQLGNKRAAALTSFAPYTPSYEGAAAFISTPILDAGKVEGILIFQMPVDEIDKVMTFAGNWQQTGLGATGETLLLDGEGVLLNNSRLYAESPEGFSQLMATQLPAQMLAQISSRQTTIGVMAISTGASAAALRGEQGVGLVDGYRGQPVFSAYSPIEVAGLNWIILSEIAAEEALASVEGLKQSIITSVVSFALVALLLAALAGWYLASSIAKPVLSVSEQIGKIAKHKDFTQHVEVAGDREIRQLARAVNVLIDSFKDNVSLITRAVAELAETSAQMGDITVQLDRQAGEQRSICSNASSSTEELQNSARAVAETAELAARESSKMHTSAQGCEQVVSASSGQAKQLSGQLVEGRELLFKVSEESQNIGRVIDVINGIAEQTNLLALNAAIEAARAGEHGRGFAVVADEVRVLSQRTQQATVEIETMIGSLQGSSSAAFTAMEQGSSQSEAAAESAHGTVRVLADVIAGIKQTSQMNTTMAQAAEDQSSSVAAIFDNMSAIDCSVEQSVEQVASLKDCSEQLTVLAQRMNKLVKDYQV